MKLKRTDSIVFALFLMSISLLHFLVDPPFRAFLWDENLYNLFFTGYDRYLSDIANSNNITNLSLSVAFVLAITALLEVLNKPNRFLRSLSFFYIFFYCFLVFKDRNYLAPIFIEHFSKWIFAGIFLFQFMKSEFSIKTAIAFTFIGHGTLACGIFPIPGNFLDMVLQLTPLSYEQAEWFLINIGVLDIAFALFLFIKPLEKVALWYCLIWGLLTALARPVFALSIGSYDQFVIEGIIGFLVRFPHFWLPLMLLRVNEKNEREVYKEGRTFDRLIKE